MPNHCENDLFIVGREAQVRAAVESVAGDEMETGSGTVGVTSVFDFRKVIPMPESYQGLEAGSAEAVMKIFFGDKDQPEFRMAEIAPVAPSELRGEYDGDRRRAAAWYCRIHGLSPADAELKACRYRQNVERHGHATWYGWSIANWGTKWNGYDGSGPCFQPLANGRLKASLTFQTAWSPPEPVVRQFSVMHPSLTVTLRYYESGMGFKGLSKYKGGELVASSHSDSYRGGRGG